MLPDYKLSSAAIFSGFLVPDRVNDLIDYEWGGQDIADTSKGLKVKVWSSAYQGGVISITDGQISHDLLTVADVTQISFAFNRNMRPFVTYVAAGVGWLWWYDTTVLSYITTELGNAVSPQLALDDLREHQSSNSDIILAYIRDDVLYMRQQRDRFQIEYELGHAKELVQIGMTKNYRFAFALKVINGFNTFFDEAIISPHNISDARFDHFKLCPLQSSYAVGFGNSVIATSAVCNDLHRATFENLENTVTANFKLDAADYDYFTAFYRVWQHKRKPFTVDLVIDERPLQRYKAHFVPGGISMQKSGRIFSVSTQLHVLNNDLNTDEIRQLAESRNE
ncbi:hypothetical protein CDG60_12205 [Acinetobacter chinensis]|uniref:Uncharacterized protein n=1 Tax=Acinetobacter chinensis TaxID=2004650 RepID=A0A3B7LWJ9_9GAMM|nr:hypothetical protein [Acinetobacter chinensis]AXY57260.1 hypothetical protein CDG60_12205 [Acinetobacter chinensis]